MGSLSVVSLLTGFLTAMVVLSETSDEGSNGDAPPKKPQEDEEKPQKVNTQTNRSFSSRIPNELIDIMITMVPRSRYPKMSLVSKYFHRLITSPELYKNRSHRNITESLLYVFLGFPPFDFPRWYILNPNRISSRLCRIDSLPPLPFGSSVVTIGHEIYVIGGCDGYTNRTSRVFLIDCRFHTCRELASMNRARYRAAAGVIDGKIYVLGGCEKRYVDWVEVFDVETGNWSHVPDPFPFGTWREECAFETYVVMEEKIYVLDHDICFSYEPRNHNWEFCVSWLKGFWITSSCVVDDMLYTVDPRRLKEPIIVYNPKKKSWRAVKGVHCLPRLFYYVSKMDYSGGKLVILGCNQSRYTPGEKDILCVKIALEKRGDGDIWGKFESVERVLTSRSSPSIEICSTVTV